MPVAAEIPKKKKPNCFDNYSGFADSQALSVQGGGLKHLSIQGGNTYLKDRFLLVSFFGVFFR